MTRSTCSWPNGDCNSTARARRWGKELKSLCPQGACRNAGVCALLTFGPPTGRRAARESAFVPRNDTRESNSEEVFGPRKLATFCACFPSVTVTHGAAASPSPRRMYTPRKGAWNGRQRVRRGRTTTSLTYRCEARTEPQRSPSQVWNLGLYRPGCGWRNERVGSWSSAPDLPFIKPQDFRAPEAHRRATIEPRRCSDAAPRRCPHQTIAQHEHPPRSLMSSPAQNSNHALPGSLRAASAAA